MTRTAEVTAELIPMTGTAGIVASGCGDPEVIAAGWSFIALGA